MLSYWLNSPFCTEHRRMSFTSNIPYIEGIYCLSVNPSLDSELSFFLLSSPRCLWSNFSLFIIRRVGTELPLPYLIYTGTRPSSMPNLGYSCCPGGARAQYGSTTWTLLSVSLTQTLATPIGSASVEHKLLLAHLLANCLDSQFTFYLVDSGNWHAYLGLWN